MDVKEHVFRGRKNDRIEDIGSVDESFTGEQFSAGPCQHNSKFACVFIPCSIPLLYLAGNLLLGVCVFAVICMYLIGYMSKERKSIITAFIISIVALQFVAIYSLLPFIWQSFFNIGLVFIYNVFLVLSGGVGLLQLKQMQMEEPAFIVYLEYILFVAYPITGQFVMTSVSALLFGWCSAPFFCIIYGFLFVQVFLVPSQSSFLYHPTIHKTGDELKPTESDIIGPMEKTLLLFNLLTIPGSLFIIIHVMEFGKLTTWIQLIFCGIFPVFLCTCLNIVDVIKFLDLHSTFVYKMRCYSGSVCLMIFSVLFWSNGLISTSGLPILYGNIILGLVVGISAKSLGIRKTLHQIFLAMLTVFYVSMIGSWWTYVNLSSQMQLILVGLTTLSLLSVGSIWMSNNKSVLSTIMVFHSAGMVLCEFFLLEQSLYSVYYAMVTAVIVIYVMFRLFIVNVVNWQATWLCWCLQSSKLSVVIQSIASHHALDQGYLWPRAFIKYRPIACVVFSLFFSKLLIFYDEKSVTFKKGVQTCFGIGIAILLAYDSLILPVWIILTNQWPSGADVAATVVLLWGLLCLRVSFTHFHNNLDAKRLTVVILCSGVFIELFQLNFNPMQVTYSLCYYIISLMFPLAFNLDAELIALHWLLLVSFITSLILLVKLVRLEHSSVLFHAVVSVLIGFPVGLKAASMVIPFQMCLPLCYGASSSFVVYLIVSSWNNFDEQSHIQRGCSFVALLLSFVLSLLLEPKLDKKAGYLLRNSVMTIHFGRFYYLMLFLVLALSLKRHKLKVKETLEDNRGKLTLVKVILGSSSLANISVFLSCILAVSLSPDKHWELWLFLCACILLLWRPEGLHWSIPGSFFASVFLVISMYLGTIITALPLTLAVYSIIGFCMEMVVLHFSLPSHIGLIYTLWSKHITLTLQQLAVFSGPINVVLLVYCSTSCGKILGFAGIFAAYWTFYHVRCKL